MGYEKEEFNGTSEELLIDEYGNIFDPVMRMNIFGESVVDMYKNSDEDVSLFNEEFSSMLYQNSITLPVKEVYTGLLPEISGNCDNIVNKVLTLKEVDLTEIGKSFYTQSILSNTPKDENSKKLYASIMNQLVCYNILNTSRKELYGSCTLKLEMEDAPAWFKLDHTCKLLVYILRERKMNALALKRSDNCDLFIETFSRDINKRDEIKSSIDYIKLIIKGDISESKYHTIVIKVKDVIDAITKELFEQKMEPMQNRLYDAEEHWTKLESIEDEVKHLEYIEDFEDKLREGYNLTLKTLKLGAHILVKLGKYSDVVDNFEVITELYGVCSNDIEIDLKDEIVCLSKNYHSGLEFTGEEDRVILEGFLDKDLMRLVKEIFSILERYRNAHLYLDMEVTPEELIASRKEDEETIG